MSASLRRVKHFSYANDSEGSAFTATLHTAFGIDGLAYTRDRRGCRLIKFHNGGRAP